MKNILFLVFCLPVYLASGNGLQISRLEVVGADRIRFHVQWEHSWRLEGVQEPYNHDAVWVFIKYREQGGAWQHLDLSPDSGMHMADSLSIQTVSDGKGVFLSRINKGS